MGTEQVNQLSAISYTRVLPAACRLPASCVVLKAFTVTVRLTVSVEIRPILHKLISCIVASETTICLCPVPFYIYLLIGLGPKFLDS